MSNSTKNYSIDPAHSHASFGVRHMMVSTVRGELRKLSGTISIDDANPSASKVSVTLETASIDTGNEQRDTHLRSGDFFDAEKHPAITFVSTKAEKKGEGLSVTGDLQIRGVTKSVVLAVDELTDAITDPWGNQRRGAHATTTIDRKDFGLTFNQTLDKGGVAIADKVNITIEIELVQV